MSRPGADPPVGRYLWLEVDLSDDPRLAFMATTMPSPLRVREKWRVRVDDVSSGTRVRVGEIDRVAATTPELRSLVYGAVHDRVLHHARLDGWVRLHMALVDVRGRRVGVVGESGSGKSTTVVALALRGARVYGDEVVFVRDGQAVVLPRPLHLRSSTTQLLTPAVRERAHRLDYDPPVFVLDPAQVSWAASCNRQHPIEAVVVLAPARREDGAGPSALSAALLALMPDAGAFNPVHDRLVHEVVRALGAAPIAILHREPPEAMAARIESLVLG